jgi:UDP-N-acetylglucosamine:LPS N-acetylglucosamine transferase
MLELIQRVQPDVIVSVYPVATEVLGGLRRQGKLDIPVVAGITDLAAMHYWAARGVDLHLLTHPESEEEVRMVAGHETDVQAVHGLTRPEFSLPCDPVAARATLGLPAAGKVVLVSGGGWGVGDLESAIDAAIELDDVEVVACLCGRNDDLLARLGGRYVDEKRVLLVGFTEQMSEWLAAADALVHSTGGLTVLEAYVRGCPTISYGWGRGHIRVNNAAFRRYGIAEVVAGRRELSEALRAALSSRPAPGLALGTLPSAASLVLALVA